MKKRILSLALVLVMVFSLMPSAFALGGTTITAQPSSLTVRVGETATFSIAATNSEAKKPLQYVWYNPDKVNVDINTISKLLSGTTFEGYLGEGQYLVLNNVQETINIRCAVYWVDKGSIISSVSVPKDLALSNTATLTVDTRPICENHSTATNLRVVPAVAPTCAAEGVREYYICNICGQYYADAYGQVKTTPDAQKLAKLTTHTLTYHAPTAGTCDEKSVAEYWECTVCGQLFKDADGKEATTIVKLKGDKDPNNHVDVEYVPAVEGTCDKKGHVEYWFCDGCNTYFSNEDLTASYKDKDATETAKNPGIHANGLKEIPAVAPTCETEGNRQYWYCDDCKNYFANAEGTAKYSDKDDVELKALGHDYVWVCVDDEFHAQECRNCGTQELSKHSVGTAANCQEPATCSICGLQYGQLDPNNHVNTELRNVKEPTISKTGYSGDVYCADCGKFIESGHEVDKLCKHTDPKSNVVVHHDAVEATCTECNDKHAGNIEYWECSECGKCWSDAELTTEITKDSTVIAMQPHYNTMALVSFKTVNSNVAVYAYDSTEHWYECKFCHAELDEATLANRTSHIFTSEANCVSGQVCSVCGYDNHKVNPDNHVGETEIVGAREPSILRAGYTGDEVCTSCGQIINKGHEYYNPCSDGCKGKLEYIEPVAPTCYDDGVKGYYKCTKCNNIYMDANATVAATDEKLVEPCTGHDLHPSTSSLTSDGLRAMLKASNWSGLGTSSDSLKDSIIGWINGEPTVNIGNISIDDIFANIHLSDIDHCSNEEGHWLGCQRCGATLADLKNELEGTGLIIPDGYFEKAAFEKHYGGTATCEKRAVCAECGEEYGELAEHRINEYNYCTVCGQHFDGCEAPNVKISTNPNSGKVVLTWDAVEGAENYQVYRATSKDGEYTKYFTTANTTYTNTSAVAGYTYYYKVRAMGADGTTGDFSKICYITCDCARPVVTAGNNSTNGKITLTWNAVDGAKEYRVLRATSKDGQYSTIGTTTATSVSITGTTVGATYYYKVQAVSSKSQYADSAYSEVVSRTCACAAPAATISTSASSGKPTLKWAAVEGATKYEIYRATSSNGTYTKYYTTTKTSYTNTSAVAGYTYYYKVKAISSATTDADSAFSAVKYITCDCAKPVVSITTSNGHPKLSWTAVDGADKYVIYRATSANGTFYKYDTTTKTTYTNSSASAGTTYYYKVVAVSSRSTYADSAYSSVVSIKAK